MKVDKNLPFGMAHFQGRTVELSQTFSPWKRMVETHRYNVSSYRLLRPGESGVLNQWRSGGLMVFGNPAKMSPSWDVKSLVNNRRNYQTQLVSRISEP